MNDWKHPTGNSPKTIALICLGPSRNAYIGAHFESDLSDVVIGVDEVWTLNRGRGVFDHDLLFVMDNIQGEADKYPRYGASLWKHDKPIITSDNCDGWPAHVHKYPFREIWNWTIGAMNPIHGDWYHNSVAYILVYAGFIGVEEVRIYGADYSTHNSGVVEDGHPNVAYWVGKLESIGMRVLAPSDSHFLNINQRNWIYGYRDDPRKIPANRARFRAMVGGEPNPDSTALLSGERQVAPSIEHIQPDHVFRYQWAAGKINHNDRVLDLGSGVGYGSKILREAGAREVVGLELSQESIEYAKKHYGMHNIVWIQADLDGKYVDDYLRADLSAGEFDSATAFEIIEHLADPAPMLQSIKAKKLYASVPNESVIPYSPDTAPFHQRHYTSEQFAALLKRCRWTPVAWHGQNGPSEPVCQVGPNSRTLIVEAIRER